MANSYELQTKENYFQVVLIHGITISAHSSKYSAISLVVNIQIEKSRLHQYVWDIL